MMFTVLARYDVCMCVHFNNRAGDLLHNIFFLLFLYSFITAVGLAEDNAVVLSASILVSPLMVGPIDVLMNSFTQFSARNIL